MSKLSNMVVASSLMLVLCACSDKAEDVVIKKPVKKQGDITMHPERKPRSDEEKSGLAEAIKKQKLPDYPAKTVGKAFDEYSYFSKREWRESFGARGKIYVDFIGWVKPSLFDPKDIQNGISAKGVAIKFVIDPEAPFYIAMVSRIEARTDGKIYETPMPDLKVIIDSIYGNKEIVLN